MLGLETWETVILLFMSFVTTIGFAGVVLNYGTILKRHYINKKAIESLAFPNNTFSYRHSQRSRMYCLKHYNVLNPSTKKFFHSIYS